MHMKFVCMYMCFYVCYKFLFLIYFPLLFFLFFYMPFNAKQMQITIRQFKAIICSDLRNTNFTFTKKKIILQSKSNLNHTQGGQEGSGERKVLLLGVGCTLGVWIKECGGGDLR